MKERIEFAVLLPLILLLIAGGCRSLPGPVGGRGMAGKILTGEWELIRRTEIVFDADTSGGLTTCVSHIHLFDRGHGVVFVKGQRFDLLAVRTLTLTKGLRLDLEGKRRNAIKGESAGKWWVSDSSSVGLLLSVQDSSAMVEKWRVDRLDYHTIVLSQGELTKEDPNHYELLVFRRKTGENHIKNLNTTMP